VSKKPSNGLSYNAFLVLGLIFMIMGMRANGGLVGVGALFLIMGLAGRGRQQQHPGESLPHSVNEE
jgi:hypothetical protein